MHSKLNATRHRFHRAGWAMVLFACLALPSWGAERVLQIEGGAKQVGRFEKIEFVLKGEVVGDNPYDPEQIDLRMEFVGPSGKRVSVPAFYAQAYERREGRRGGGGEWIYPVGGGQWKVRFAPTEVGAYTGQAVLKDRGGAASSDKVAFECVPSQRKGFIRVSARNPRYFEFDDGTPFFAIGQNVAFVKNSLATMEMIRKLGENGANFARVWACSEDWAMAIEARKSAWGRSWDWNPPIVLSPDREGFHSGELCLKLTGEAGAALNASPCLPVALRAETRYRLSGRLRGNEGQEIALEVGGSHALTAKRQWTRFEQEFVTGKNQWFLSGPSFRLKSKGTAWLKDLSLTEAGGGPELLWEADVNRPVRGVYNQPDCFMLDQVVEAAEQSGVHLQVVLFTRDHYMGQLTKENSGQYDQAIAYAKRLARYASARWGYSTHIASWEHFNEMNPGLPTNRFYAEVGQAFESIDVNRHLRATSTWSAPAKDYRHPQLETADLHYYIRPATGALWKDDVESVLSRWKLMEQNASLRPIVFAEFGITDNNWQRARELDKDKAFVHLHNALWASALSGFASTVCHWYWDDIHRRDLYPIYRPIARFAADIPWTTGRLRPASGACDKGLRLVGLQGEAGAYLWIHDPQATWWNLAVEGTEPPPVRGAKLSLEGLNRGAYRLQWWDTRQGTPLGQEEVRSEDGKLTLSVPEFARDLACKITRIEGR